MKERFLYAPIPILIAAGLVTLDFFMDAHYGIMTMIVFVTVGCTVETARGYFNESRKISLPLLGIATTCWILWVSINVFDTLDLVRYARSFARLDTVTWHSYFLFFAPLLVLLILALLYGMYKSDEATTNGLLVGFALMTLFVAVFSHGPLILEQFYEHPDVATLWMLFLGVNNKLSDTGAYLVGKYAGKHKMTPTLSPEKTWEGFAGSIVTGLIVGMFFFRYTGLGVGHSLGKILSASLLFSLTGVLGDLFGSLLKRGANMDDSSGLLAGIGGILDMSDSFLLSLPVAFFWFILVL